MVKHLFKVKSIVSVKTHLIINKVNFFSKELASRYEGPYRVLYFFSPVTCLIQRCDNVENPFGRNCLEKKTSTKNWLK